MANVSEQDRTIHRPALRDSGGHPPVSYTHLTLPTNSRV